MQTLKKRPSSDHSTEGKEPKILVQINPASKHVNSIFHGCFMIAERATAYSIIERREVAMLRGFVISPSDAGKVQRLPLTCRASEVVEIGRPEGLISDLENVTVRTVLRATKAVKAPEFRGCYLVVTQTEFVPGFGVQGYFFGLGQRLYPSKPFQCSPGEFEHIGVAKFVATPV